MNLDYWTKKILGKATCSLSRGAKLSFTARIRNIRGLTSAIKVGDRSFIAGELLTFAHGGQIEIGQWCYIGEGSRIWSAGRIDIGDRVMISHNVNIFDNLTHPVDPVLRHQHFRAIASVGHPHRIDLGERPVRINDDAWIAAGAMVLRGVTIGKAAIVGAGAVVTHDVPPFAIVAGNPARVIRYVKSDEAEPGDINRKDKSSRT
jgi:acetyltransferase-like isoleucine patch superfamily enzyme